MDLQEFVTQTLLQIIRGISDANKVLEPERKKPDGSPLPKLFLLSPGVEKEGGHGVHFDVAVTARSETDKGAGAKASLSVLQFDVGGKQIATSEQVSRINFSVQIGQWHG
jgi:hypothetical protein